MASTQNPFGNGLLAPLRRGGTSDFVSGSGEALLRDQLLQLLMTEPGALEWRPSFGAGLGRFRNQNLTNELRVQIEAAIMSAVANAIPRIRIQGTAVTQQGTTLTISIRWAAVLPGSTSTLISARSPLTVEV